MHSPFPHNALLQTTTPWLAAQGHDLTDDWSLPSDHFVDSLCPFRCSFGCILLLHQMFCKQCTVWQYDHRTLPPKGGSKTQNGSFRCKITLRFKKVCYKVSLYENCQRQICEAFIGLTICAKMTGGGDPFYLKFQVKLTVLERNHRFFNLLSPVVPQP